jgi:excisionase family DNA binding protein
MDPLASLLDMVRAAARQGATEALTGHAGTAASAPAPLLDKRGLAHALGVSMPTIDRLCREGRVPYVQVGESRRFDLQAVRAALAAPAPSAQEGRANPAASPHKTVGAGVRLLSRQGT